MGSIPGTRWLKSLIARCLLGTGGLVAWCTRNRFKRYGVWLDVSSKFIHPQTRAALFWGLYESSERRAARKYFPVGAPVVELGASIGFITLQIGARLQGCKQVAVEANAEIIPILSQNLALNGMSQVTVVSGAIDYSGAECCRIQLAEKTDGSRVIGATSPEGRSIEVRSLSLGQILKEQAIDNYALVADIEGAEYEVITREDPGIRSRCVLAMLELHTVERAGRTWTREDLAQLFCKEWRMKVVETDGKVWIFRPAGEPAEYRSNGEE